MQSCCQIVICQMVIEDCVECEWQTGGRAGLTKHVIKMRLSPPVWECNKENCKVPFITPIMHYRCIKRVVENGLFIQQIYIWSLEHICLIIARILCERRLIFYSLSLNSWSSMQWIYYKTSLPCRVCISFEPTIMQKMPLQSQSGFMSVTWFSLIWWLCNVQKGPWRSQSGDMSVT